jgi:hypothetical protein
VGFEITIYEVQAVPWSHIREAGDGDDSVDIISNAASNRAVSRFRIARCIFVDKPLQRIFDGFSM